MSDDSHSELPSEFEELGIELEDTFSPSRQVTSFEIEQSDESDPEQRASRESETAAGLGFTLLFWHYCYSEVEVEKSNS